MEPRPPRTRSSGAFDRSGRAPAGAEPGRAAGSGPELDPYGVTAPPIAPEFPLVPRQQRRRQRLARTFLGFLLLLIALGAAGWYVSDRFIGDTDDDAPPQLAVASPPPVGNVSPPPAAGSAPTPTRAPRSASLIATATAVPTPETEGEPTAVAGDETDRSSAAGAPQAADADTEAAAAEERPPIEELLPSEEQVLDGLVLIEDATRTEEEVVASLGSEDAVQLLDDWGWEGNVFRRFASPEPDSLPAGSTIFLDVSIHRFADAESASQALTYFSDQVVALQGLEEVATDPIGDETRVLQGAPDGVLFAVGYFQDGVDLIRVSGSSNSAEGDPTSDVVAVAESVIGG